MTNPTNAPPSRVPLKHVAKQLVGRAIWGWPKGLRLLLVIALLPELVLAAPIFSLDSGPLGQSFIFLRFGIDENRGRIAPAKAKETVAAVFARRDGHGYPLASQ